MRSHFLLLCYQSTWFLAHACRFVHDISLLTPCRLSSVGEMHDTFDTSLTILLSYELQLKQVLDLVASILAISIMYRLMNLSWLIVNLVRFKIHGEKERIGWNQDA